MKQPTNSSPENAGQPSQHPGTLAALRFVLIHHQPPTRTGRCPTCRRHSWRGLWRRHPFPCVVWQQIRGELLGHLTLAGCPTPRHRARSTTKRGTAQKIEPT